MKPIKFEECNFEYAKDQEEYLTLPVFKAAGGEVVCCWGLTWRERLRLLFTGRLWLGLWTFNRPLQPLLPTVRRSDLLVKKEGACDE